MELIEQYDKLSYADVKKIKFDNKHPDSGVFQDSLHVVYELDANKYPDLKDMILEMQAWDKTAQPYSVGATYFLLSLDYLFRKNNFTDKIFYKGFELSKAEFIEALSATKVHLLK